MDTRPLRRAFLVSFLAAHVDATILSLDPATDFNDEAAFTDVDVAMSWLGVENLSAPLGASRRFVTDLVERAAPRPVIIISDGETRDEIVTALDLGVRGYISTSLSEQAMNAAIHLVLAGGLYAPIAPLIGPRKEGGDGVAVRPKSAAAAEEIALAAAVAPQAPQLGGGAAAASGERDELSLSTRQVEVLTHLRHGMANKEIAYRLKMSESTVKVHVRNIMRKLGATNRTQAAFLAQHVTQHRKVAPAGNKMKV